MLHPANTVTMQGHESRRMQLMLDETECHLVGKPVLMTERWWHLSRCCCCKKDDERGGSFSRPISRWLIRTKLHPKIPPSCFKQRARLAWVALKCWFGCQRWLVRVVSSPFPYWWWRRCLLWPPVWWCTPHLHNVSEEGKTRGERRERARRREGKEKEEVISCIWGDENMNTDYDRFLRPVVAAVNIGPICHLPFTKFRSKLTVKSREIWWHTDSLLPMTLNMNKWHEEQRNGAPAKPGCTQTPLICGNASDLISSLCLC